MRVTPWRGAHGRKAHSGTEQSTIPTSQGGRFGLTLAAAGEVAGAGSKGVVVVAVDRDGTAAERGFAAEQYHS